MRGRPSASGEPSSTRYIFAYEDDDEDDDVPVVRRERKSHRYPVAKEQFRYSGDRSSRRREYRREYIIQAPEQPQPTRREYVAVPAPAGSIRSAVPASYRTEFVQEPDARVYGSREFYDTESRPVTVIETHPVPAADGPASVIIEDRGDVTYGRREYGSVRADGPMHPQNAYVHAASNDRSDMLY